MRKRLDDTEATRRRIVDAAVELHGSVGPAHTTFSGVAKRAGVQRSTVYRHFADEEALFGACTAHWSAMNPPPDPDRWNTDMNPVERLSGALREIYDYFDTNDRMLSNAFRDAEVMPDFVMEQFERQIGAMHEALVTPWIPTASDPPRLTAALRHALDFRAWQSLAGAGLDTREASALMTEMVSAIARGPDHPD